MCQTNSPLSSFGRHQYSFSHGLSSFFLACAAPSYETASTMSNSTSLLARRRRVQRLRPSGGGLHATATRCASWAPSSLRRRVVGDGRGRSAASGPSSTHRVRTRSTLERHVQRVHNLVVTPGRTAWPFIGLQENARVHQRASRRLPYTHQLLRVSPLLPKQLDVLNLAHTGLYRNRQDYPSKAS